MATQNARTDPPLVTALLDALGEDLRTVITYDEDSQEPRFVRENVEAIYSDEEFEAISEAIRLEGWGRERLEALFKTGELECNVYGFDEAKMVHFVRDGFAGALVTYDRGADLDDDRVVEICKEHF